MTLSSSRAKYVSVSALLVIVGIVLSGPVGVIIIQASSPQPPWQNAGIFVENYSPVQAMPYAFGFVMVLGFLLFFASLVSVGEDRQRPLEMMGPSLGTVFGSLISLNYIIQIAYLPHALDQDAAILSFLAMANPTSVAWAIEMFGYGILGVATIAVAPLFSGPGLQRVIRWLLVSNGIVSVGGSVVTAIDLPGILSTPGLVGYVLWNILVVIMMALVMAEFRFGKPPRHG